MLSDTLLLADPLFFEDLARIDDAAAHFAAVSRPSPEGWSRAERSVWIGYRPTGADLPPQGWKIHVSATEDGASSAVDAVWQYCVTNRVHFKFLRSSMAHRVLNMKYAERGASGKLAVIYPADEAELARVLTELGATLAGRAGPYILGDLRWQDGPLYVRYGGFLEDWTQLPDTGEWEIVIRRPDGSAEPDRRHPVFRIPEWIELPDILAESHRQLTAGVSDFPYTDLTALHYSNGGGVYAATRTADRSRVVLKEARPHAGLDPSGADAVARLRREAANLVLLDDTGLTPRFHRQFTAWEHEFLESEFVDGATLSEVLPTRYPYVHPQPSPDTVDDYLRWATELAYAVEAALAVLHDRGLIYGDLHPDNIMVRPDGSVTLLDLEFVQPMTATTPIVLGHPAFRVNDLNAGPELDAYALAALRLHLLVPATALLYFGWRERNPTVLEQLLAEAHERFPTAEAFLAPAIDILDRWHRAPRRGHTSRLEVAADDEDVIDGLVRGILASATPQRADRLFPGSPEQHAPGGALSLAYGAAGVLHALARVRPEVHLDDYVDWLAQRALSWPVTRVGLYDGLAGVAEVLAQLGAHDAAASVLDRCRERVTSTVKADLFDGVAGVALAVASAGLRRGDQALLDEARQLGNLVARSVLVAPGADPLVPDRAGLLHGRSGLALALCALHRLFDAPTYLDAAELALTADLEACVTANGGALHVDDGYRILLYLGSGSIGIGVALNAYLAERPNPRFEAALAGARRATDIDFALLPGLFSGTAGIAFGARMMALGGQPSIAPDSLDRQRRQLRRRLIQRCDGIYCPADGQIRLSADLASGSAGALLALSTAPAGWTRLPGFAEGPLDLGESGHPSPRAQAGGDSHEHSRTAEPGPGRCTPGH